MHLRDLSGFLPAIAAVGCSGAAPPLGPTTWASTGGLSVVLQASPDPPQRGLNTFEFVIRGTPGGMLRDDLVFTVAPWMPADRHGPSIMPVVTAEGQGRYQVTPVDFFIPGHWVLKTNFAAPVMDYAEPAFDIP